MTDNERFIVVVEDDSDVSMLLEHAFSSRGYKVKVIDNGADAHKYLFEEKGYLTTHLLLLDRILPDMDGLEILRELTKLGDEVPPVLVLSVLSSEREMLTGLKQGAIDYIGKPFNLNMLVNKSLTLMKNK